ncbi:HAD-IC family P-type ATPase [Micromonospora sp. KC207]|uniref:cation-translocating P-type ATPase n=1 Tax=Micromonospora sp. KC207 TaxID=2530377 RepID=UPI001404DE38|nr:HAD-IC family P-type ATPase [Micromonospora sp. KC207]
MSASAHDPGNTSASHVRHQEPRARKWRVKAPHGLAGVDVLGRLDVDPERGLAPDEVNRRRAVAGRNALAMPTQRSSWRILLDQVRSVVIVLLAAAVVAGLVIGETLEAAAVAVVIIVNTIVGFVTELRALRSMEALRHLTATRADVERQDRREEIDAVELVPGDLVSVEAGDQVPADIRVLEAEDLTVEESALTGESETVVKTVEPVPRDTPIADRTNMLYSGTTVRAGRGRGVVVATGPATEVGHIADLAASTDTGQAPLKAGLEQLGRILSLVVVGLAAALVGLGLVRGLDVEEVIEVAIALAVAIVPEGLPAVATLTLTVGMRRMARAHALVRRLPTVETLGSTNVIAADKTGTLTANEMHVVEVALADGVDERALWQSAVICNDADISPDGTPVGDPTEVALLLGGQANGLDWRTLRVEHTRRAEVPFDSSTKRMAVVTDGTVHAKGAPEVLLDPQQHAELLARVHDMSSRALRTLAIGAGRAPAASGDDNQVFDAVDPLGVVGMIDPPRPAAVDAVRACHRAGIRVVMITGDQPRTAAAVAREVGLRADRAITGAELDRLDDDALAREIGDSDVFARVAPEQKLRLVRALQAAGGVVAVTGDGVNDAPALRQADVGIAMGRTGTDVAREAADIVLTTDDFSTIEHAIQEGRRIFANIRRFGQFLFSWHLSVVLVVTVALALGLDAPIVGLMILWNNLIIDVIPSFALALEPSSDEAMREPPRSKSEPVLGAGTVRRILIHGTLVAAVALTAYLLASKVMNLDLDHARTMTFVTLTSAQLLTVFNARTNIGSGFRGATRNPYLWAALALTIALESLVLGVPAMRDLLDLTTLRVGDWAVALSLGVIPVVLVQTVRIVRAWPTSGSVRARERS